MSQWKLTPADPIAPRISADARAGRTHYPDDHTWQVRLGQPDEPAVALETRYGGRAGLARLVPTWTIDRRQVLETQGYHRPPAITAFAPDLIRLAAAPALSLDVTAEFWAMESQAVGGRFVCRSTAQQPLTLRLDLNAQAARENKTIRMFFLTLETGQVALHLGQVGNLQPVLLLEGGSGDSKGAHLGWSLRVEPGQQVTLRWALGSLPDRDASLGLAHRWLAENWDAHLSAIQQRAATAPQVETGHAEWDAALAWSQQAVLRSFLGPTSHLPHPSFVLARRTGDGLGVGGTHAGGFYAPWGGQSAPDALLIAPTVALAAPDLAQGLVRNFLAVQRDDGWIDARPGLDGQRTHVLAAPLLAALARTVYDYTGDRAFLEACFDGLLAFFLRWFKPDMDRDGDGLPEWTLAAQGAFADGPTFASHQRWASDVDPTTVEAPDLAAYLLREAETLIGMAELLGRRPAIEQIAPRRDALRAGLAALWDAGRGMFVCRDRDTHAVPAGEVIFEGKGDQTLRERTALPQPGRLVLRVTGGLTHKPKMGCTLEGLDAAGKGANETLNADQFNWYRGQGIATTRTVWSTLTHLRFEGLSRVYSVQAVTVDLARPDQSRLVPLWTASLDEEQAARTLALLTDPAAYWRAYGIAGYPANGPAYDPAGQNGPGGVWPRYNALLAGALIERGHHAEAAELFKRLLAAQIRALRESQGFRALYHPDTGEGLGDGDVISGAVSWGWFQQLFGAFVRAADEVVLTGPFAFVGETMTWTQHGIRIERSAEGTRIRFPAGREVKLKPDAPPQVVRPLKAKAPSKS